ncbi:MAG TPA: Gfo/Idh/MocA family oxidoreductase, partial [Bryobacteraceae bacterium]|nr:Gfo/Idh/MocA family oxidoreductase [Bryobacteraceae bacterium]
MPDENSVNRRDFLRTASIAGSLTGFAGSAFARPAGKMAPGRVIGANDKINVGVIGVGGRGAYVANQFHKVGEKDSSCRIAAVCDVYEKRKMAEAAKYGVTGYLDYRELLAKEDVDAVIVATPDHWHATIALAAMDA